MPKVGNDNAIILFAVGVIIVVGAVAIALILWIRKKK